MQKLTISLLLLAAIGFANCASSISDKEEYQTLKRFVQPIIKGTNAHVTADLNVTINGQSTLMKYEFWSRNQTRGQWATTLTTLSPLSVYRSVYSDNQLTRLNDFKDKPDYFVLEHLLTQGPQIDWTILKKRDMQNGLEREVNGELVNYYDMHIRPLHVIVGITSRVGNFPQIWDILYSPPFSKKSIEATNIVVKVVEELDDNLFKAL